jgi:hypothetical protein
VTPAACIVTASVICVGLAACVRHADIVDEPDALTAIQPFIPEAGDIPTLDSGVGSDAFPPCADRTSGLCRGPVDFPCDFERWVPIVANKCQHATGCITNGWMRVKLGPDGCVAEIGMEHPSDAIVACLVSEFSMVQCPCANIETKYFFGVRIERCPDPLGKK